MKEYIEREAVMQMINDWAGGYSYIEVPTEWAADKVRKLPAADVVEVKHGRWIPVTNGRGGSVCNQCHAYAPSYQSGAEYNSPYCPNCGAKMDGGADDAAD